MSQVDDEFQVSDLLTKKEIRSVVESLVERVLITAPVLAEITYFNATAFGVLSIEVQEVLPSKMFGYIVCGRAPDGILMSFALKHIVHIVLKG